MHLNIHNAAARKSVPLMPLDWISRRVGSVRLYDGRPADIQSAIQSYPPEAQLPALLDPVARLCVRRGYAWCLQQRPMGPLPGVVRTESELTYRWFGSLAAGAWLCGVDLYALSFADPAASARRC